MITPAALAPTIEDDDVLLAAERLVPRLRARAAEIEAERRVPHDLVDELIEAGLFHLLLPRSLGGLARDPLLAAYVVETLATGDASTAWVTMLALQTSYLAGFLPPDEARAIWTHGGSVAGTARAVGRATPARHDGVEGYVVSGRWPFGSGSSHATSFAAECKVDDGGHPRLDAEGNEVHLTLFVPRAEVKVHQDTWYTLGLRGSASHDYSIDGAFVPATRGIRVLVDPPRHPWPLYRALSLVFVTHGALAIGVARAALEEARGHIRSRHGWGDVALADQPRLQSLIAEATAKVESARSYLYATAEQLWDAARRGEQTPALQARTRLATSYAAIASLEVVDMLHRGLGTAAVMSGTPIERHLRDIHTAAAHVMVGQLTYEAAGRVELGADAGFPYF